mgnify:CR=1 FL=1
MQRMRWLPISLAPQTKLSPIVLPSAQAVNHAAASTRKLLAAEQLVPLLPQQGGRGAATHAFAAALETHAAALQAAVQETTQLLQYISLNMTAIRKV